MLVPPNKAVQMNAAQIPSKALVRTNDTTSAVCNAVVPPNYRSMESD